MKKVILGSITILVAMGLHAGETMVEKLHGHYSEESNKTDNPLIKEVVKVIEEKASKPTQRAKNLNDAAERWSKGEASEADKELIKVEDGPFIKRLQDKTVYGFQMDIDNPIYHVLSMGGASLPTVFATMIDLYTIKHCTNDLSKMVFEDFQSMGAMKEYGVMVPLNYASESNAHPLKANREDYVKFIHAARAFNCGDERILEKYLDIKK